GRPYRTSFMSGVPDTDQLGDQCGALLPLDLNGHLGRHAHAVARHFLSIDDPLAQADARTRRHGTDEANFVGAVVDAPAPPRNPEQRRRHPGNQRERKVAVGDRLAPGHLAPSSLDIHVDPLVVACGVGEPVDHRLIDRDPLRWAQLAPDMLEKLIRVLQREHRPLPWRSHLAPGGYHPRHLPRVAMDMARIVEPAYSTACPTPPPAPILAMIARITSLAFTPSGSRPSTVMRRTLGFFCQSVWVAITCSTSVDPMPNARAQKAPCVAV